MQHLQSAGSFEGEFYDDGYPLWITIRQEGSEALRLHHSELSNLQFVLDRLRREAAAHLNKMGRGHEL